MEQENIFPNYTSDSHSMDEIPHNFLPSGGLTKREYFAIRIYQSIIINPESRKNILRKWEKLEIHEGAAKSACACADALLKELSNANTKN